METAIITSIITGVVTLTVCLINSWVTVRSIQAKNDQHISECLASSQQTIALIELKLDSLTSQVEKHNKVVERTFLCEQRLAVAEEKISVGNHRIDDLERSIGGAN